MKRSTALILSLMLFGVGLVLADNLLDWSMGWKIAVAVALALVPFYFIGRGSAPTPGTTTTPAAAITYPGLDKAWIWILTILLGGLVLYGAVFWVSVPIRDLVREAVATPDTHIVENGFPRHDAPRQEQDIIPPFNKILSAGKTYQVFKLKRGDIFNVTQLSAPIRYKIENPVVTGFAPIDNPIKIRVNYDGNLLVVSTAGRNTVMIARE